LSPGAYPRFLADRLVEALADAPAVLLHGPRQSGKTTLARSVGEARGYRYFSFDEDVARAAAEADPVGYVADLPERAILDEVQRVPSLFTALKVAIDRGRSAGRFLLTGSANVLLVPKLADSLAGRLALLRLHPLAQCEVAGERAGFIEALFSADFPTRTTERLGAALADRIVAGGYPTALARQSGRRSAWYRDYVDTLVQRDVRDQSQIRALEALPRLLTLAATQTARLINFTELAGPFQLVRQTIHDYVTLLERVFLIDRIPPWHQNRLSRLVKTAKLHMGDTGIACALLDLDAAELRADRGVLGQMLETFVYQELKRLASWSDRPITFHHLRDRDGVEVDLVLEQGPRRLAAIEVKAAATVQARDFQGLRKLQDAAGQRFAAGIVLYDGGSMASFGDRLFAVPLRRLWEVL
jgi:predicted AAA+ superfamily ATPase